MKHIKLFENFDEFKSEIKSRRTKSDNWSMHNIEGLLDDGNSIRMFIKVGSVVEILNLLSHILNKGLYNKQIPIFGDSGRTRTVLYLYFLYLIDYDRKDVLVELNFLDKVSGKLSEEDKQDLSVWLKNSKKVSDEKPFYNLIDSI